MERLGVAADRAPVQDGPVRAGEVRHAQPGVALGLEEAVVAGKLLVVYVNVVRRRTPEPETARPDCVPLARELAVRDLEL